MNRLKSVNNSIPLKWNWYLVVILVIVLLPQLFQTVILSPDSHGYINFSSERPPLLPILIWINHLFVGDKFYILHFSQIGFIAYAMYALDRYVRKEFNIPTWLSAIAILLFLIPTYISFHAGRRILTEPITFPLFALMLMYLFDLFLKKTPASAIGFSITSALLILSRNQFYFLYGFMLISLMWMIFSKVDWKTVLIIFSIFAITVLSTSLLNRTYHYLLNHAFSTTTANGPLLLVQPMFLANKSDVKYFENSELKRDFLALYNNCSKLGYLFNQQKPLTSERFGKVQEYAIFQQVFDPIQFGCIVPTLSKFGYENRYELNSKAMLIASILLKHNWKINLKFYLWKIMYSLGGKHLALLWLLIGIASLIRLCIDRTDRIATVSIVILIFVLANSITIAISEMMLDRYLAYSFLSMLMLGCIFTTHCFWRFNAR